ncbi:MAG TPA: glutamate--tRNA ligase [Candidatus Acidoferrales bacterium]|nr:glutamate--tRNA ligase [Candidatus Acidoferrales bacterium]
MIVRTRVAPSPTGDPHVGTAFVALINYCFAKHHGGEFLLRIEDTDRARSTAASERVILDALGWLGITWDEGPGVGGPHGPYRQSERLEIYTRYADLLLRNGHAFRCYCTPERLEAMRDEQRRRELPPRYDGRCLTLTPNEISESQRLGLPSVVRMKIPDSGTAVVRDLLRGDIVFDWSTVDMQILLKSDGWPTYHLANVVDDHLMEITHVMRGEEWLSSAPKHLLLYEYFGWEMPQLCHLPLLRNADKSKLSKRKNPTSINFYRRMGYLPEALRNFLGNLANAPGEGEEILTLHEFVDRFDVTHIPLGGPVFDVAKLDWLNGRYIRERNDVTGFMEHARAWAFNTDYLAAIAPLAQTRVERLSDLGPLLSFFFAGRLSITAEQLLEGKLGAEMVRRLLAYAQWELDRLAEWDVSDIERVLREIAERLGVKFREAVRPWYIAITGSPTSVPLFNSMGILGRDLCRERLRVALQLVGGVSKAEQRAWQRAGNAGDDAA